MNSLRRSLLAAGTLAALGIPAAARAQAIAPGRNFDVLNPTLPVDAPAGKFEVLEFFWYGCIHCYNFEPTVEQWLKTAPGDVVFRQVPVVFNDPRTFHDAKVYYTLEAMGLLKKMHVRLFEAIHKEKLDTTKKDAFTAFLGKAGVDAQKFDEAFRSFGVDGKSKRAVALTKSYRVEGTPSLAVHGTYTITADQGGSARGMFAVADQLVAQLRKSKPAAKK